MSMMRNVSDIIHTDYRDYSLYVLGNRAIPSVVDGLKPSQRKAVYTATKAAKNFVKTASLVGQTIADAHYHHGDAALGQTINLMAADWCNNAPLFEGEGSFGSRMVPAAAAPRYTSVRLSENFKKYFQDNDILPQNDDPENPEPKFYLPLIPWVLVNGVRGIAIGFATEIQPRNPTELKNVCVSLLKGRELPKRIKPFYKDFRGKILFDRKREQWFCRGVYELKSKTQIHISELPIGMTREKYVAHLDKLEDNNKISSYQNRCDKTGVNFHIQLKRGGKELTDRKIISMFKLESFLNENLTVLDEEGEVLVFENEIDLIRYFCRVRLAYIERRLKFYVQRDQEQLRWLDIKKKFIQAVIDGKIVFINVPNKKLKKSIKKYLVGGVPSGVNDEEIDRLLSIRTSQYTSEKIKELDNQIKEIKEQIKKNQNTDPKEAYIQNLEEL